jgi:hypothetical protein
MSGQADDGGDEIKRGPWISTVTNVSGFLGGFSLASVVVISAGPGSFRWPGWAALAFTIASVLLLAAAQEAKRAARNYSERHEGWHRVIWVLYHGGIVALLAGLGAALAPKPVPDAVTQLGLRWATMWVAFGAAFAELFLAVVAAVRPDPDSSKGNGAGLGPADSSHLRSGGADGADSAAA